MIVSVILNEQIGAPVRFDVDICVDEDLKHSFFNRSVHLALDIIGFRNINNALHNSAVLTTAAAAAPG